MNEDIYTVRRKEIQMLHDFMYRYDNSFDSEGLNKLADYCLNHTNFTTGDFVATLDGLNVPLQEIAQSLYDEEGANINLDTIAAALLKQADVCQTVNVLGNIEAEEPRITNPYNKTELKAESWGDSSVLGLGGSISNALYSAGCSWKEITQALCSEAGLHYDKDLLAHELNWHLEYEELAQKLYAEFNDLEDVARALYFDFPSGLGIEEERVYEILTTEEGMNLDLDTARKTMVNAGIREDGYEEGIKP